MGEMAGRDGRGTEPNCSALLLRRKLAGHLIEAFEGDDPIGRNGDVRLPSTVLQEQSTESHEEEGDGA